MAGRFRLLDKWLDFVRQRKHMMRVINEDQWRQVGAAALSSLYVTMPMLLPCSPSAPGFCCGHAPMSVQV